MTNPPGPSHGDPSPWARPSPGQPDQEPSAPAEPTEPAAEQTTDSPQPPPESPTAAPDAATTSAANSKRNRFAFLRDPLSIVLILITVVALATAGLIGGELIGRHIANGKIAETTECEVEDGVNVSFGASPPFLWQHARGRYTNISIQTAGNRLKDARQMQADLHIENVRLHRTGDSAGTIGSLDAAVTWPSEGIKDTVRGLIPFLGNLVQSVTTHPDDGTVELKGPFGIGGVIVKPWVDDGALSLEVVKISGLAGIAGGVTQENAQVALNTFSKQLVGRYPLGIHPDRVEVTDTGVDARFSTRDAPIPLDEQNPCFANL